AAGPTACTPTGASPSPAAASPRPPCPTPTDGSHPPPNRPRGDPDATGHTTTPRAPRRPARRRRPAATCPTPPRPTRRITHPNQHSPSEPGPHTRDGTHAIP